jgi:protein-L-isoaspartate(D-aspartate) O-methyltransferase
MAPFDVVLIEGRIGEMPQSLIAQVAEGGRMAAVLGESAMAKAHLWVIHGTTNGRRAAFDASVAALPGFERVKDSFVFQGFNEARVS